MFLSSSRSTVSSSCWTLKPIIIFSSSSWIALQE